ncbi:hypothetical protein [Streptomyces resistomycificus]|uniref:hypothetical protein n=1 Tax=Streptomyces resistomycificus TaxID=67356 RepID=UPI00068A66F1|nr:hypothetical protein [Streptomyces resistomycificus]KUN91105.1 hypothetical protein AQJ84_38215 [Streptomyces resistomycificus]
MSDSQSPWEPSARVAELLYQDFDGAAADPDDVISEGLDGGYQERSEALREVLRDPDEDPAGRFLACVALTRWADAAGYEAVLRSARSPESTAWRGASYDRLHGQDDTFGVLADAVGDSVDMVEERGTAAERLRAAEALLSVADRVQFDRHVSSLLRQELVVALLPAVRAAVERGIARPADEQPTYDLGLQLALMIAAAHRADATWALDAARRLIATRPGARALAELHDAIPETRER